MMEGCLCAGQTLSTRCVLITRWVFLNTCRLHVSPVFTLSKHVERVQHNSTQTTQGTILLIHLYMEEIQQKLIILFYF